MAEASGVDGPTSSPWPRRVGLSVLVSAYLLPVWLFHYVPTQDGPAHLANAVILRDYGTAGTRHHEFYFVAVEPFPNWTAHLALAGLCCVVHPLIAEKLLITLYVVGFVGAYAHFLGGLPGRSWCLVALSLLFVYNRCFFMGFYSYCLSLPLLFWILGVALRLPDRLSPGPLVILAGLFLLTYFTHLVGYFQAASAALVLVMCRPGARWIRLVVLGVSMLPSLAFCVDYLMSTGASPVVIFDALTSSLHSPANGGSPREGWIHLTRDVFAEYHGWTIPVGLLTWVLFGMLAMMGLGAWLSERRRVAANASWWPVLAVLIVMALLYVGAADNVGSHGGYLKPRLAIVVPLVALALLRPPTGPWTHAAMVAGCCTLVAVHLACIVSHFAVDNRRLEQYTAGIDELGRGQVIYVVQTTDVDPWRISYLLHASSYYSLDTACTNLDNYEATAHYFPVRFRSGVRRGRGGRVDFPFYPRHADVDRILAWEWPERPNAPPPDGFRTLFREGSLTIYGRVAP